MENILDNKTNQKEHKVGIYKITNPIGKIYIGQSTNIFHRWDKHYKKFNCKGQTKLYNSLKKYGIDNHKFEIIEECPIKQLDEKELYYKEKYINEYGWENSLFLMLFDGKGGNKNKITKLKMSISSTKIDRKIKAYTLKGTYIGEFNSASEIKNILFPDINETTGGILSSCRRGSQKTFRGFLFQFSDDDKSNEIIPTLDNNVRLKQRKILQYTTNDEFVKEYDNSYQVEKEFKEKGIIIHSTDIRACCSGKQKTSKGYKWRYGESLLDNEAEINLEDIQQRIKHYQGLKDELDEYKISKQNYKNKIYSLIKEIYDGDIIVNYNNEIDVFIPHFNVGFNIYSLKEHIGVPSKFLYNILEKYEKKQIKIIQIFSDEITQKSNIVKSRIKNGLGLTENKLYARKCSIQEINSTTKNNFLTQNHIQGKDNSKIKLGLFYNNELVSVMTFGVPRKAIGKKENNTGKTYELIRFCNKINYNVIGAASKLYSYFLKNYSPDLVYSFADNRWSSRLNNLYLTLGFNYISSSKQGYSYTKNFNERLHRYNFNKQLLSTLYPDKIENKTEKQLMTELGYFQIWDCGVSRYEHEVNRAVTYL